MKRCTKAHAHPMFGEIPAGSLWADDSPFVADDGPFVDADKPARVKKSTAKREES